MMKICLLLTYLLLLTSCMLIDKDSVNTSLQIEQQEKPMRDLKYPVTNRVDVSDEYFGTKVADPYRWLEDDRSPEVAAWVKEQNALTQEYLSQIPFRKQIGAVYEKLMDYERVSAPFREGNYSYFYKNSGLQNQDVLYRKKESGTEEVFIDPNQFSEDGTVSLEMVSFTKDGSLLAYSISEGGSDWQKIVVMDARTGTVLEPELENIKFSGIAWRGNEGFYYSSYDKPEGSVLSEKTENHKLYFHKLGNKQEKD